MSIASEISRLQTAKADIKTAIENKGVTVADNLTISSYAPLIDEIETGADILNGIIRQYKAYTTGANVTVSANTFIEFVNVTNEKTFNTGIITLLDEIDSTHLFVLYGKYSNNYYRVYGAVMSITTSINVINAVEVLTLSADNRYPVANNYAKHNNNYAIYYAAWGYLLLNVDPTTYTITKLSDESNIHDGARYFRYLTTENSTEYYGLTQVSSGQVVLYLVKVTNNTISEVGSPIVVFSGASYYSVGGGAIDVEGTKFLITCSQNGTMYYYIYSISNEVINLENNNSFINMTNISTIRENNKLYTFYRYDNKLRLMTFTIDYTNNIITSDNNSREVLEATSDINKNVFITDRLWLFTDIVTFTLSCYCFNKTTLAPIEEKDILQMPTYVYDFTQEITMCEYNDEFVLALKSNTNDESTVYNLTTDGEIVIGGDYVIPSTSKIEGLTKTDCTDGVAGDVWVLNREQN